MDKKKIRKALNIGKNYVVDTTGLFLASTPIYAGMEVFGAGMDVATSLESRLKVALLGYLGMGFVYAKGRDLSRKIFKLKDTSKEWKQTLHDSIYNVAFNFSFAFPVYLSSGADLETALKGAGGAVGLGLISGPINGYSIDTFRHLTGTKHSERMPKIIKGINKKARNFLAAASIVAMVGTTAGVYKIKDKYFSEPKKQEIILEDKINEDKNKTYYFNNQN